MADLSQLSGRPFTWRDTWPVKLGMSALSALALAGDVNAGRVSPGSDTEIQRAADLAGRK